MIKYSLVVPCFNEGKNLAELVNKLNEIIINNQNLEVIIVNNGSTDDSKKILSEKANFSERLIHINLDQNAGYGGGILKGLNQANGDFLIWTHADLQTDINDVNHAITSSEASASDLFIKGNRKGRPFLDNIFTAGMSFFESFLFRKKMFDINAQPTLLPRTLFETWNNPPTDFSLDLYAYITAIEAQLEIKRISVKFLPRKHGQSTWNTSWTNKWKFIKRTLGYSIYLALNLNRNR